MAGGYFYFKDGWTKFAAYNMIEEGNWIAYEYFSHGILDFKVYDRSDCLTQGVGGHISNKPDEQDINIEPYIDVVGHTDDRGDHPERANVMDAREGYPKGSQEKDKRRPREDSSSNDHPRGGQVRDVPIPLEKEAKEITIGMVKSFSDLESSNSPIMLIL